jgi:hypothetical protein
MARIDHSDHSSCFSKRAVCGDFLLTSSKDGKKEPQAGEGWSLETISFTCRIAPSGRPRNIFDLPILALPFPRPASNRSTLQSSKAPRVAFYIAFSNIPVIRNQSHAATYLCLMWPYWSMRPPRKKRCCTILWPSRKRAITNAASDRSRRI